MALSEEGKGRDGSVLWTLEGGVISILWAVEVVNFYFGRIKLKYLMSKKSNVKGPSAPPAKGSFEPRHYAKNGVSEEEVKAIK